MAGNLSSKNKRIFADTLQNVFQIEDRELTPLDDIFVEQPLPLLRFIGDANYMNLDQSGLYLSDIQEDLLRHFEQVLKPETYIEMVRYWGPEYAPVRFVNDLSCAWGKGSGKDMCIQLGFARIANLLLCLKSPHAYYEIPNHTSIHMLNVAASSKQAHGVFFKPLRNLILAAPWFNDKYEGDPPGPQAGEIRFKKQIELISGHSDPETLEGKNLIAAVADEISAFPLASQAIGSTSTNKTADALVDMLRSSAVTRFATDYKVVQISYPRAKKDAILQAVATAKTDEMENGEKSRYYSSGPYRTWDVNPKFEKIDTVEIPGAAQPVPNLPTIVGDYKKNIAFAKAKYECDPEAAMNRFFKDDAAILDSFSIKRLVAPITISYEVGIDPSFEQKVEQWQARYAFSPDFTPIPGALYSVHGDMAISGDRAGIAVSHVSGYRNVLDIESGRLTRKPEVTVDFIGAWEADSSAVHPGTNKILPREVQLRWFREFVLLLAKRGFPIGSVTQDGFQSADGLQILQAMGYPAAKVSMDRDTVGYQTLKDVMYEGRLTGYFDELLITEIAALNQYPNGKIDHLPGGSKDLADAVAGAVLGAVTVGGEEEDEAEPHSPVESLPDPGYNYDDLFVTGKSGWGSGGGFSGVMGGVTVI